MKSSIMAVAVVTFGLVSSAFGEVLICGSSGFETINSSLLDGRRVARVERIIQLDTVKRQMRLESKFEVIGESLKIRVISEGPVSRLRMLGRRIDLLAYQSIEARGAAEYINESGMQVDERVEGTNSLNVEEHRIRASATMLNGDLENWFSMSGRLQQIGVCTPARGGGREFPTKPGPFQPIMPGR